MKEIETSKKSKEEELRKCQDKFKKEFIEMEKKFKADLILAQNALKGKYLKYLRL